MARVVSELFPPGEDCPRETMEVIESDVPKVSRLEVEIAAGRITPGKAPGLDGVPPEAVRALPNAYPTTCSGMIDGISRSGVFPIEWKTARLVLVPEPGKKDAYSLCAS